MKYLYLLLLTLFSVIAEAQTRTNLLGVGLSGQPPPLPLAFVSEPSFFRRAVDRIELRTESRLVRPLTLALYLEDTRENPDELGARYGKSLFADGFRYSLREWGLRTPAYDWLDYRFSQVGDWFSSFWRDTLSANVERNNVQLPGTVSFLEERGRFHGFKKGLRPFSGNPYAFAGYGWRNSEKELLFETTLRAYVRDWRDPAFSLMSEIPIRSWSFGFGIEGRGGRDRERESERFGRTFTDIDRAFDVTLGLKGRLGGGLVHIGADVLGERVVALWSARF